MVTAVHSGPRRVCRGSTSGVEVKMVTSIGSELKMNIAPSFVKNTLWGFRFFLHGWFLTGVFGGWLPSML